MGTKSLVIHVDLEGRTWTVSKGKGNGLEIGGRKYRWKGSDAELVELIYLLKEVGVIEVNGRLAVVKEIADLFGLILERQVPRVYYTRMMNEKRKKDKHPFLNRMLKGVAGGGEHQ
jgi:hypothetical protein